MMDTFKIRPYPKWELAKLYFPNTLSRQSAVRNLYNLMVRNRPLMEALKRSGYLPHSRILTARQVRIIVEFLEEP